MNTAISNVLPPLQASSFAWTGPDMARRHAEWLVEFSKQEIAELETATAQLLAAKKPIAGLKPADFPLPTLGPKLVALRQELLHGRGFAVLRGLPVERYSEEEAGTLFYGLGCHVGNARSQNAKGHLLGHVRDAGLSSTDPNVRIYQTRERQQFHTDSCDVVGLLCLQTAMRGGRSILVSAVTLFNEMRARHPELLAELLKPFAFDRRGEVPAGEKPYYTLPVYSYFQGYLSSIYQRQYIESAQRFADVPRLTRAQTEALDALDTLANDEAFNFSMQLQEGDVQFVYNHALLHDRTGYEDWPDTAKKRHLLRLWLSVPGDRPLPQAYVSRFGSVEIGNRGGIIAPNTTLHIPLLAA